MPKSRNDNLKLIRSVNEAREKGQKGGIASGESRRKKRALKEEFETLLEMAVKDKRMLSKLTKIGVEETSPTFRTAITAAMIREAMDGNVKAFTAIRDTIAPSKEEELTQGERIEITLSIEDVSGGSDED